MQAGTSKLTNLQFDTKNVRNICILAHVDHGKTTITDRLISTNGIISPKLAGKVRYMDSTPAEQEKGITMKSSAISLLYISDPANGTIPKKNQPREDHLINVIDSPGHVDFSGEVSTAVRLSDGGVVVVDVVEGVCIQTQAVLRQAWNEKVQPCLVLNKIDRLFNDLHLTDMEAYQKLNSVLEQVNAITGSLWHELMHEKLEQQEEEMKKKATDATWSLEEEDDSKLYFAPERGNVVFASAIDGWGFRIHQFAAMHAKKLGMRRTMLQKTLWGEYYANMTKKRIYTTNDSGKMVPMFVGWIMRNIFQVYAVAASKNQEKINKIVKFLNLTIPAREIDVKKQSKHDILQAIMSRWLPFSDALLSMVVETIPSPLDAQKLRIAKLWNSTLPPAVSISTGERIRYDKMVASVMHCDKDSDDLVVFVSKVYALDKESSLPRNYTVVTPNSRNTSSTSTSTSISTPEIVEENKDTSPTEDTTKEGVLIAKTAEDASKIFIAFGRIFSGTLKVGQKLYVMGPKFDPREPTKHRLEIEIRELFICMGKELQPVNIVPAGNIFGIGGIQDIILKSATLSTHPLCPVFSTMIFGFAPIVTVAVEPKNYSEMSILSNGLKLLNQSDPCVEIVIQESGEHVIMASGELHLERCLRDLKELFAQIEIEVSAPLVSFRETIVPELANGVKTDLIEIATPDKKATIKIRAVPLPSNIREFLEKKETQQMLDLVFLKDLGKKFEKRKTEEEKTENENTENTGEQEIEKYNEFRSSLIKEFKDAGGKWYEELERYLWSFGPRRVGPNLLLNHIPTYCTSTLFKPLGTKIGLTNPLKSGGGDSSPIQEEDVVVVVDDFTVKIGKLDNGFISGFQIASLAGPLCAEPITGVAFIIEDISFVAENVDAASLSVGGLFSGQIISAVKEGCRDAFMAHSVRIVEPMYECEVQVTTEGLSSAHKVLGRRRAQIVEEYPKPGTDYFSITAHLPVVESFGFSNEIRTETSGRADAQLMFSHWQTLDEDPYFVPATMQEIVEFGDSVDTLPPPVPRRIITDVRKRKGLPLKEKLVKAPEKQRNLSRKK